MLYTSFYDRPNGTQRQGVVLLIVIVMLALFATVALAFVFYAEAEAVASLTTVQAQSRTIPESDPELLLTYFLNQLIYPTANPNSAIRGHDLGTTAFGSNPNGVNAYAYSGIGRLHYGNTALGFDDYYFPNYQYYPADVNPNTKTSFIRDPEFYFDPSRTGPSSFLRPANYRAGNAPWTYQDPNSMFLARVDADGSVITPSFHRPWLIPYLLGQIPGFAKSQSFKYAQLIPDRINYHTSMATPDSDAGGDVRNLDFSRGSIISTTSTTITVAGPAFPAANATISVGSTIGFPSSGVIAINMGTSRLFVSYTGTNATQFTGCTCATVGTPAVNQIVNPVANNDSYWLDLGWPVMIAPNGRKYKALFAPLIVDLDNRINMLLASANSPFPGSAPSSNRGYGPTEVSISSLGTTQAELDVLNQIRFGGNGMVDSQRYVWTLTQSPVATNGSFTITVGNPVIGTTGNIPYNATAPQIQAALQAVVGAGNAGAIGGPINTSPVIIRFAPMGKASIPISINATNLVGTPTLGASITYLPAQWPVRNGPVYARIDIDGNNGGPLTLPWDPTNAKDPRYVTGQYYIFPDYPDGRPNVTYQPGPLPPPYSLSAPWYSGPAAQQTVAQELIGLGIGYNMNAKMGDDNSPLSPSHMEALLRHMSTGATAPTSSLFQRMPLTFSGANGRNRNLVTLASWGLDRISGAPYISYDPKTNSNYAYNGYPKLISTLTSPAVDGTYTPAGEFTAEYRSNLPNRRRVNLNRLSGGMVLTTNTNPPTIVQYQYDYPTPDANGVINLATAYNPIPPWATNQAAWTYGDQVNYAQNARQLLARDIFNVLVIVTGAQNPNKDPDPITGSPTPNSVPALDPTQTPYQATRWLAQLAVNIVDYIDNDDYMTPFNWDTTNNVWVYGTEQPRLVVNEVYAQQDATALSVWAELYNPFKDTTGETYPSDGGKARLIVNGNAAYQLYLLKNDGKGNLNVDGNVDGSPLPGDVLSGPVQDWGNNPVNGGKDKNNNAYDPFTVYPANGASSDTSFTATNGTNQGFYVIAPDIAPLPYTCTSANMKALAAPPLISMTVLLRRLANPAIPPQLDPTKAFYNPYITTDYLQNVTVNPVGGGTSFGRRQPYAAGSLLAQGPPHTFFSQNTGIQVPFDWLTHLDRPLVNSLELLHVSSVHPHRLTHRFVTYPAKAPPIKFQHYAPWQDPNAMIYRALDLLGVPPLLSGTSSGGRVPGKININTMNELEVAMALFDPQAVSNFSAADVATLLTSLRTSRTPNGAPGQDDRPFMPFTSGFVANTSATVSDPQYKYGSGIDDTLLRTTAVTPNQNLSTAAQASPPFSNLLLTVPAGASHPYQQMQLLQKIYNNTTTTSNVFAVWLTVGFFEVDDSFTPAKIGSEIGRDQGRQVRHRLFSIVDRTALSLAQATTTQTIPAGNSVTVPVSGTVLNTMVGNQVDFGPDPLTGQSQVVTVTGVNCNNPNGPNTGTITAKFGKPFQAGTPVIFRGNPGPWPRTMSSVFSAAYPAGSANLQVTGVLANIPGTVSNIMIGTVVTIGPDPNPGPTQGNTEQVGVIGINTSVIPGTPTNPILTTTPLTKNYTAGTPITWRSSAQYQPRNDPVVMHMSVIQ